jgi:hypothetical protein
MIFRKLTIRPLQKSYAREAMVHRGRMNQKEGARRRTRSLSYDRMAKIKVTFKIVRLEAAQDPIDLSNNN